MLIQSLRPDFEKECIKALRKEVWSHSYRYESGFKINKWFDNLLIQLRIEENKLISYSAVLDEDGFWFNIESNCIKNIILKAFPKCN